MAWVLLGLVDWLRLVLASAPLTVPVAAALAVGLTACATSPPPTSGVSPQAGSSVVAVARDMLGTPYQYGGASPAGFDCSGLVRYAYQRVGDPVPRTVAQQLRAVERLPRSGLAPGDLVFFELDDKPAHVGIYVGDQSFIHAPSSGGVVHRSRLDRRYWRERFIVGGRL